MTIKYTNLEPRYGNYCDHVICGNCGTDMIVPVGTCRCPTCGEDMLQWADPDIQEVHSDEFDEYREAHYTDYDYLFSYEDDN